MKKLNTLILCALLAVGGTLQLSAQTELIIRSGTDLRSMVTIPLSKKQDARSVGDGLYVSWNISPLGSLELIEIEYENKGAQLLKLEWVLQHDFPLGQYDEYWDGSSAVQEIATIEEEHEQSNIRRMAPWTGVFSQEVGSGVGLGLHPLELKSYIRSKLSRDNHRAVVEFATRTVASPGEKGTIRFFQTEFPVRFGGMRELTQIVHDAFPQAFHPHEHSVPVYYGASAQYMMSRVLPESTPGTAPIEHMRRVFGTWDWSYTPFKRTGDHWGEEDLWDYEPNIPFSEIPASIVQNRFHFNEVTRDEFMQMREEHFNRWGKLHGILFYAPGGTWVEKQLALDRFSDALTVDPNYRYDLERWVTGWDREVKVFPWYTSYEPFIRSNFEKLAEHYDTSGVALDVARGGPKYRGPITEQPVEGRAWDEDGLFLDQGIGVAHLIDFLHTLPVRYDDRYVLSVVGNPEVGGQTFTVTTRYDAGMYEGPPYHPRRAAIPLARYLLGQKPMTWWAGWMYHRYAVPNWENHDREHFEETMQGLVDYGIFSSFEWAGIPPVSYQWGIPKLRRMMPDIIQCVRDGWQAVFPVAFDRSDLEHLHTARYSNSEGTTLFWGNPYDEPAVMAAEVENSYLGERDYVFVDWIGNADLKQIVGEGKTRFEFDLLSREPVLQKAIASFQRNESKVEVTSAIDRSFATVRAEISFSEGLDKDKEVRIASLPDYHLAAVRVDGSEQSFESEDGVYRAIIPAAGSDLELVYARDYLLSPAEQLLQADYFEAGGKPVVRIEIEGGDKRTAKDALIRLQQYFAYYSDVAFKGSGPYRFRGDSAVAEEKIVLKIGTDSVDGIQREGAHQTTLTAADSDAVTNVLDTFLALLDEKYPYLHPMSGTWGTSHHVLAHNDYLNGYLPDNTATEKE